MSAERPADRPPRRSGAPTGNATMSATFELVPGTKTTPAYIVVRLPVNPNPPPSKSSGKTVIVAPTGGNAATPITVNGKVVKVGMTAFIPAE